MNFVEEPEVEVELGELVEVVELVVGSADLLFLLPASAAGGARRSTAATRTAVSDRRKVSRRVTIGRLRPGAVCSHRLPSGLQAQCRQ
jgi:hypothetical protein